jgi:DNA-binding NtrC family response regulator
MPSALIVDDDEDVLSNLADLAEERGFDTTTATCLEAARSEIRHRAPDLALLDVVLPDGSALDLLMELPHPGETRVILMTGRPEVDTALSDLPMESVEYLRKPLDPSALRRRLDELHRELIRRPRDEPEPGSTFPSLVGESPPMMRMFEHIDRFAALDSTVLLVGESGTGKELVARALHDASARAAGPFVPLNCGAVPETLIDSELFGHEKGAFTGARSRRSGVFEQATGGTLLLDEVSEMPPELQVRLLRVLETGVLRRVGGNESVRVDTRVVAATNRRPEEAIREGALREDLFYRLAVVTIELPPLRTRIGDPEILARHFLTELNDRHEVRKRLSPRALETIRSYHWPGNVRQLRNAVERAFVLSSGDLVEVESLPEHVVGGTPREEGSVRLSVGTTISEAERRLILATLERFGGNREQTAEALGISVRTLYNRLRSYEADGTGESPPSSRDDREHP